MATSAVASPSAGVLLPNPNHELAKFKNCLEADIKRIGRLDGLVKRCFRVITKIDKDGKPLVYVALGLEIAAMPLLAIPIAVFLRVTQDKTSTWTVEQLDDHAKKLLASRAEILKSIEVELARGFSTMFPAKKREHLAKAKELELRLRPALNPGPRTNYTPRFPW